MIKIIYDGWSLVHAPLSPAALHLQALLEHCPSEVKPVCAAPGPVNMSLPRRVDLVEAPAAGTPWGHLAWEAHLLPGLVRKHKANLLHTFSPGPALMAKAAVMSPAGYDPLWETPDPPHPPDPPPGLLARLGEGTASGGLARLRAVFWPSDLPAPNLPASIVRMPPIYLEESAQTPSNGHARPELPPAYVLYHGSYAPRLVAALLAAWSWAAGPVGESTPLLLLGVQDGELNRIKSAVQESKLEETVRVLSGVSLAAVPALYQGCSALVHLGPVSPWGSPLYQALAAGRPVVGFSSPYIEARLGPAGYLAAPGDTRTLGAALITVIVEESISESLVQAAQKRTATWKAAEFEMRLLEVYRQVWEL